MSALDDRIDDLYRQPLDAFIGARTALAKSLTGADAARVRRLAKPTVVPWAINQVYWHSRRVHDALMTSGRRLRDAQLAALEGKRADVREASEAHRRALGEAVRAAERMGTGAGLHPDRDALMRTFEALSLRPGEEETPGRLTKPLAPAGFEALGGVRLSPGARAFAQSPREGHAHGARAFQASVQETRKQDAARQREEAARRKRDQQEQRKTDAARRKREAEVRKAEAALERARRRMAEAELKLRGLR